MLKESTDSFFFLLEPFCSYHRASWRSFFINPTKIVLDSLCFLLFGRRASFFLYKMKLKWNNKIITYYIVQIFTFNWPINYENEQSNLLNKCKTIKFVYMYKIYSLLLFVWGFRRQISLQLLQTRTTVRHPSTYASLNWIFLFVRFVLFYIPFFCY